MRKHNFPPAGSTWRKPNGDTRVVTVAGLRDGKPFVDYWVNCCYQSKTLALWNRWAKGAEQVEPEGQG